MRVRSMGMMTHKSCMLLFIMLPIFAQCQSLSGGRHLAVWCRFAEGRIIEIGEGETACWLKRFGRLAHLQENSTDMVIIEAAVFDELEAEEPGARPIHWPLSPAR